MPNELYYLSPEDYYIHKEEVKEMLDGFNDRFEIIRALVGKTSFDIWTAKNAYGGSTRELAISFHMSRHKIRKHLIRATKRLKIIMKTTF